MVRVLTSLWEVSPARGPLRQPSLPLGSGRTPPPFPFKSRVVTIPISRALPLAVSTSFANTSSYKHSSNYPA